MPVVQIYLKEEAYNKLMERARQNKTTTVRTARGIIEHFLESGQ